MDHSYDFHIALYLLQLNEYGQAEKILKKDIGQLIRDKNKDWVHHLDLFYYGISLYEQKKYKEAVQNFDWALSQYPAFSDVQYYEAKCLEYLHQEEAASALFKLAQKNGLKGQGISEDNVIYEQYPYQVRWH